MRRACYVGAIAAVQDKGSSANLLQNCLECIERPTLGLCSACHQTRSRSLSEEDELEKYVIEAWIWKDSVPYQRYHGDIALEKSTIRACSAHYGWMLGR